jgi:Ribulose-5-phosphate 4-epimerase and related epimerases and aldolases
MPIDVLSAAETLRPQDTSPAEWRARVELAACYRVFAELGWTELVFNHITLRVPGSPPAFLINPFGLNYDEVTAANLIKVGHDGAPLQATPHAVNGAGFVIHSVVHAARADVHCVMHTHTTAGMAVACKRDGLGHDDFYGAELFGDVAYHAFEGITVHDAEGPRLVASLGAKRSSSCATTACWSPAATSSMPSAGCGRCSARARCRSRPTLSPARTPH